MTVSVTQPLEVVLVLQATQESIVKRLVHRVTLVYSVDRNVYARMEGHAMQLLAIVNVQKDGLDFHVKEVNIIMIYIDYMYVHIKDIGISKLY